MPINWSYIDSISRWEPPYFSREQIKSWIMEGMQEDINKETIKSCYHGFCMEGGFKQAVLAVKEVIAEQGLEVERIKHKPGILSLFGLPSKKLRKMWIDEYGDDSLVAHLTYKYRHIKAVVLTVKNAEHPFLIAVSTPKLPKEWSPLTDVAVVDVTESTILAYSELSEIIDPLKL